MPEKICVFCDHFGWNNSSYYDYGGETGGGIEGGGVTCNKGMLGPLLWIKNKWEPTQPHPNPSSEFLPDDADDFRRIINCAERCPHYSPPKSSSSGGSRGVIRGPMGGRGEGST